MPHDYPLKTKRMSQMIRTLTPTSSVEPSYSRKGLKPPKEALVYPKNSLRYLIRAPYDTNIDSNQQSKTKLEEWTENPTSCHENLTSAQRNLTRAPVEKKINPNQQCKTKLFDERTETPMCDHVYPTSVPRNPTCFQNGMNINSDQQNKTKLLAGHNEILMSGNLYTMNAPRNSAHVPNGTNINPNQQSTTKLPEERSTGIPGNPMSVYRDSTSAPNNSNIENSENIIPEETPGITNNQINYCTKLDFDIGFFKCMWFKETFAVPWIFFAYKWLQDIISVDDYTYFNQPRRQSFICKSGGLGFLVHNSIAKNVKVIHTESDYISCLSLSRQYHHYEQDIILASVYIPPKQSRFHNQDEMEMFEQDVTSLCSQYDYFITIGDFNAQTGTLDDFTSVDNFLSDHFHFDEETIQFYDQKCELERLGINTMCTSMDKKK